MDGSDALRFRHMLPEAQILAFEPNPGNFESMNADNRLLRGAIRVVPFAASNAASVAPFYVLKTDDPPNLTRELRGMSSLHKRPGVKEFDKIICVRTVRLDELLQEYGLDGGSIALWIDTEGQAFEAVCGASNVLERVALIQVEVETSPIIGSDQKLFSDVNAFLEEEGFHLLATDRVRNELQFNALYVRARYLKARWPEIRRLCTVARIRRKFRKILAAVVPERLRRYIVRLIR